MNDFTQKTLWVFIESQQLNPHKSIKQIFENRLGASIFFAGREEVLMAKRNGLRFI